MTNMKGLSVCVCVWCVCMCRGVWGGRRGVEVREGRVGGGGGGERWQGLPYLLTKSKFTPNISYPEMR